MTVPENTSKDNSLYALVPAELTAKLLRRFQVHPRTLNVLRQLKRYISSFRSL